MKYEMIEKVNKMGKIGLILSNIGKVIMVIATILFMVLSCVCLVLPKDFASITMIHNAKIHVNFEDIADVGVSFIFPNENVQAAIEMNDISYEIISVEQTGQMLEANAQSKEATLTLRELSPLMLFGALFCGVAVEVFRLISRLCKNFKVCETPFTEEISNVLRRLAFAVIPLVVIGSMFESALDGMENGQFNVVIHLDLVMIVMVVLILMLSSIFRYGAMLQQESDETL